MDAPKQKGDRQMIGDRIKERRTELGMTQDELAKRIGFKSRSSVNKIELGKTDLSTPQIKSFADALGVSPVWLLDMDDQFFKDHPPNLDENTEMKYGKDAYRMLTKYMKLSNRDRIRIEERIDIMLEESK